MKKGNYRLLIFSYVAVFILFLILNKDYMNIDYTNLAVSIILLLIVLIIILNSIKHSFKPTEKMSLELQRVSRQIKNDFKKENKYLWDKYKDNDELFRDSKLENIFNEYKLEMNRLEKNRVDGIKCCITDYFNKDLVDDSIHRSLLNLVPGVMTGLGILGTFIGLSFGLKNFNTGTTEEITNSIEPLMNGIKVAFHTSIYGMVFSLIFNFIYKKGIYEADNAVDEFITVWNKYVCPDSVNDTVNMLLEYQQKQNESIAMAASEISESTKNLIPFFETINNSIEKQREEMSLQTTKINDIFTPQFGHMNEKLENFASVVSKSQIDGVSVVIDKFINEMNKCMEDNFKEFGAVVKENCECQKNNTEYMQQTFEKVGNMIINIQKINEISEKTVESLSGYVKNIEELQEIINQNFMSVNIQTEENYKIIEKQQTYVKSMMECENNIISASDGFEKNMFKQLEILQEVAKFVGDSTNEKVEKITETTKEYNNSITTSSKNQIEAIHNTTNAATTSIDKAANNLVYAFDTLSKQNVEAINETFNVFNKKLSEIAVHLSGTILEVNTMTERVPKLVSDAYYGMEKSYKNIENDMEKLLNVVIEIKKKFEI